MGLTLINGLPAHVLLVHVVVVLVPLTALALVVCAIWPFWIRRLGIALPLLALVALISVPVTMNAGDWLENHLPRTPLLRKHTELGGTLLPWALGLFVLAVVVWWYGRGASAGAATATATEPSRMDGTALGVPVRVIAIVLSVVVAAGSVVQVYRIGDSGAKAAWQGNFSAKPLPHYRHHH